MLVVDEIVGCCGGCEGGCDGGVGGLNGVMLESVWSDGVAVGDDSEDGSSVCDDSWTRDDSAGCNVSSGSGFSVASKYCDVSSASVSSANIGILRAKESDGTPADEDPGRG